jgi:hypothetical protein
MTDRAHESRVRRLAKRYGCYIRKSRQWIHPNNLGEYRLVDTDCNWVVLGEDFEATLDEIEHYLKEAA